MAKVHYLEFGLGYKYKYKCKAMASSLLWGEMTDDITENKRGRLKARCCRRFKDHRF